MAFACLAEGSHRCTVAIPGGDQDSLRRFLSRPKRPMAALLNRQRMECQGQDHFLYQSRPFGILQFEIRPRVLFSARWSDQALMIAFQDCQIRRWSVARRLPLFVPCGAPPFQDEVSGGDCCCSAQSGPSMAIPASLSKVPPNRRSSWCLPAWNVAVVGCAGRST